MPRIPLPVYKPMVSVPGGVGPTANAPMVSADTSIASAFGMAGRALERTGNAVVDAREVDYRLQVQDEKVRAAQTLAQARTDWEQHLLDRKESAQPGAPDFTGGVLKDFDEYAPKTIEGFKTREVKGFVAEQMASLRASVASHAMAFEATARVDYRKQGALDAVNTAASGLELDPGAYADVAREQLGIIDSLEVPPAVRTQLRTQAQRALAYAATAGFIRKDPAAAYEALTGVAKFSAKAAPEGEAPGAPAPLGPADAPRGIRNNNPGNITKGASQWRGEVDNGDPRYTAFATPELGIRAMAQNLLTYQDRYGLKTPADIIARWAPASENATDAYVAAVAKKVGVKPDEAIDLHDPATMGKFVRAMVLQENGQDPYSDQQVGAGVAAALDGKELPVPKPSEPVPMGTITVQAARPTGLAAIDALDWKDRLHLATQAQAESQRRQEDAKAQIGSRVKNAEAMARDGLSDPNPITQDAFVAAYGQRDGLERYSEYARGQQFASDVHGLQNMTPDQRTALLERTRPTEGTPDYAVEAQRWQVRAAVANQLRAEEQDDPMATAMKRGIGGAQPLDFNNPDAMKAELAKRAGIAATMAQSYQTKPQVLTKGEAQAFAQIVKQAPPEAQKRYLGALYSGLGSDIPLFKLTMQQVAPDAPVVALAGIYQAKGLRTSDLPNRPATDVADLILRGNAILNPRGEGAQHMGGKSLVRMPAQKDMLAQWTNDTGAAFKGKEQAGDLYYQGALSIYAALAAERGIYDGTLDSDLWKASIQLSTGGVERVNGSEIVMPYGWKRDDFTAGLATRAADIVSRKLAVGVKSPDEIADAPLESIGDGRYLVRRGTGYLVDAGGRPLVVDFNTEPQQPAGLPAAYQPPQPPRAAPYERGRRSPIGIRRGTL
jgi:hypothetical protein